MGPACQFWRDFRRFQPVCRSIWTGSLGLPATGPIKVGPHQRLPSAHAGSARNPALAVYLLSNLRNPAPNAQPTNGAIAFSSGGSHCRSTVHASVAALTGRSGGVAMLPAHEPKGEPMSTARFRWLPPRPLFSLSSDLGTALAAESCQTNCPPRCHATRGLSCCDTPPQTHQKRQ